MASRVEARRLLDSFLSEHGITNRAAGAALGVTHVTVIAWRKGNARPGSDAQRDAIERYTRGRVPAPTWFTKAERLKRERASQVRPYEPEGPSAE